MYIPPFLCYYDCIMNITISLAGIPVELMFDYPDYLPYYKPYITDEKPLGCVEAAPEKAGQMFQDCLKSKGAAYAQHVELSFLLSDFLLKYDRVFFHGTAFSWQGRAWIVTAPPGTGKTTHFMLWKKLFGEQAEIICGDKPILECGETGIIVHSSPWNGKENMGQRASAPLGGVILLERGDENSMERVGSEAIGDIYRQFLYSAREREAVRTVFMIEDRILRTVPVWKLTSRGDESSAILCRDTIREALK